MSAAAPARSRAALGLGLAAAIVVPWSGVGLSELDGERRRQEPALVGVVGHWSALDDGGPALVVDGPRWSGVTEVAALDAAARSLFPNASADAHAEFVANGAAAGAFPFAVAPAEATVADATIRVQFKLIGGATDQIAGIVFGLQPNGEYLFARYNTRDGNVAVWAYADGVRERVVDGADHAQLPLGVWHELVVTIAGPRVTASVAGTPLKVEHTMERPPIGRVGVWAKRDAVSAFRTFRVAR